MGQKAKIYDVKTFIEGVEHGVFFDADGFGEGVTRHGIVVDQYILPSDIDVLSREIDYVRWFPQ